MPTMELVGHILQASYRITAGVPVVYLFGRADDGSTFLVRDRRQIPHFYVRHSDTERATQLGAKIIVDDARTLDGAAIARVQLRLPQDALPLRDALHAAGIDTFEADVRFAYRYLIDRQIKGACRIVGAAQPGAGVTWEFDDPELSPAVSSASLSVLSFDIETDPKAERLLAISLYNEHIDEVIVVDGRERAMPDKAVRVANEFDALEAFCRRVKALDPDVITGWNVIDFDLSVLSRIAARVGQAFTLGRVPGTMHLRAAQGYFGSGQATVPGRLVLDGIDLLRGAFVRMDDYSLDAVARQVLGEGKALLGDNAGRADEIQQRYEHDLTGFCEYARTDARLVLEILEKMELIKLALARSRLTGMTPDRVAASIASFDFVYLCELARRRLVAPSVRSSDSRVHQAQTGGHVMAPRVGMHDNVWVFDFKSLYPSIMRTFNIDPLARARAEGGHDSDLITLDDGTTFARGDAVLPDLLANLFAERQAAKERGDSVASQAIKILMNSFYGVLGTPACRFYDPKLANAITGLGKLLLLWARDWFKQRGYAVLYGDTDSLFVAAGDIDAARAMTIGDELVSAVNVDLETFILARWNLVSRLELEFEKLYERLFLPSVRGGDVGAAKRYAGVVHGRPGVEFVGMEVVRRDWTDLAKEVQRELYARLFDGRAVDEYLSDFVQGLRRGERDATLVYRKGLRKPLKSYTATTPPHVAAARKLHGPPPRVISYVMTSAGPEPVEHISHALDYEHYLNKQIRPVAEPVLGALGLQFDHVIGDDRQISLF
jgi:DNA polymerase-2